MVWTIEEVPLKNIRKFAVGALNKSVEKYYFEFEDHYEYLLFPRYKGNKNFRINRLEREEDNTICIKISSWDKHEDVETQGLNIPDTDCFVQICNLFNSKYADVHHTKTRFMKNKFKIDTIATVYIKD